MTYVLNSADVLPAATRAEATETKTAGQGFWQRLAENLDVLDTALATGGQDGDGVADGDAS